MMLFDLFILFMFNLCLEIYDQEDTAERGEEGSPASE